MKKFVIWLCSMLAIVLVVNTAGGFFVKLTVGNMYYTSLQGFSKKAETLIHPEYVEPTEEKKSNGLHGLAGRSSLSNGRLTIENHFLYNFLFMNIYIDESHIFFDKDGTNELSSGIFAIVFKDDNGNTIDYDYLLNAAGVVNINEFCKLEGTDEIYKLLKEQDVTIRLDSYTINENYVITPVELTVLDREHNEILHQCYPANGEIIKASDLFFHDVIADKENSGYSMYKKMTDAYRGVTKADKIAEKLVDKAIFDGEDQRDGKSYFTFGALIMTKVEVTDNKAMITALRFNYIKGVILYTVIFGTILTVIMVLVIRAKKRKNA